MQCQQWQLLDCQSRGQRTDREHAFVSRHRRIRDLDSKNDEYQTDLVIYIAVVWNSLPLHLRSPSISRSQFQAGLKTHLFRLAFH